MIVYASRTGNVRYIVSKLNVNSIELTEDLKVDTPYLLITYTDRLGEVPAKVSRFLERNGHLCKGVVVSGNTNFGHQYFGAAGDKIALAYQVPLVRKIELRGFQSDYEAIQQFYEMRVENENLLNA
ncbi:ribonucleotide reductase stimulatory protein [Ureibacillus massiliensis 4400831 = CIP 108448 = CCUG 49529]|uniref:Ribonucleotide reductase stimulatory protein n=1 Tax=Ureibacillus massiliensis 4400831 = CIP 108448 = CCUG 49529 TaxID=1211035 RepID=A0A0A3JB01_9BACL|nr:class Ib ribonucleoside-diphosphate reductase assembly flavoprotein NrdI [Ureibacillus massiliensis]KGR92338.1 ribonucleotide reductase stimulatory protein [Ureibacillus massiliensis 4400831 = CIP 108448 = CCUG 49529]